MLCYKNSGLVALVLGATFYGCNETTLSTCPVIINPLNTGQQIKLIPNQKVNEYAIALVCSTNTPAIVGGSKRCLSQAEDGPYISSLFQTCSGAPRNVGGSTVSPTGKGQLRPPFMGSTNLPPASQQSYNPSAYPQSQNLASTQSTSPAVPTASTTSQPGSSVYTTEETTTTTTTTETTTPEPEATIPARGRSGRRVTFDTTDSTTSEPSTESITTLETMTESTGFFDFAGGFF